MGIGTFGAFTQARLGIYAAQTGLNVTGNNISNINTPGYTRQRLDQVSLYTAGSDRYYAEGDIRTGQGPLVKSLSQIRSPYLDIRYRTEAAKVGYHDARLESLNEVAMVLDEVGKGDVDKGEGGFGILGLDFNKIASAMRDLVSETGHQEYDNTVRQVAKNLITKFNSYAARLEEVRQDTITKLDTDIEKINGYLTSIRSLNEEIRKGDIHGDPGLELRDRRNLLIDELSQLIDINVTYSEEELAAGVRVEKLTISLDDANPDKSVKTDESLLVDGVFSAELSFGTPKPNPNYQEGAALYLDENNNPTNNPIGADGVTPNKANPAAQKYLAEDGTPTNDLRDAEVLTGEDNPYYSVMISQLKNKNGDLHVYSKGYAAEKVLGTDTTGGTIKDQAGADVAETIADLFKNGKLTASATVEDQPSPGDKTITIYTRIPQKNPDGTLKDPPVYDYTKQVFEQLISKPVALDDNDLNGQLQAHREFLTEEGEFTDLDVIANIDEGAGAKRGILYYQKTLDLLANQFAKIMNEANQGFALDPDGNLVGPQVGTAGDLGLNTDTGAPGGYFIDANGNYVGTSAHKPCIFTTDPLSATASAADKLAYAQKYGYASVDDLMADHGVTDPDTEVMSPPPEPIPMGGVLFSNNPGNDDPTGITAANISISNTWDKTHLLVRSFTCPWGETEPASGQSDNLTHMEYLLDFQKYQFVPTDLDGNENASGVPMFEGTFFEMWNNIGTVLGEDQTHTETMLETHYENALAIDTERDSVSSVDFNDEAMNLMMYAKSYNAACRLMTTIDSVLDKLINNTGMTT